MAEEKQADGSEASDAKKVEEVRGHPAWLRKKGR